MKFKKQIAGFEAVSLIIGIVSIAVLIGMAFNADVVSAEEEASWTCCEKTTDGGVCQDVIVGSSGECVSELRSNPSKCEATSYCKAGCCYDAEEGTYDKNTPQALCSAGEWYPDANCNVPGAQLGCCVLGERTAFVTNDRCLRLSELNGVEHEWLQENEAVCFARTMVDIRGACVAGESCKVISQSECGGNFHEGYLCTAPELNTSCEKTEKTSCVEGKDGVYFLDSCGNAANIYDSSKVDDEEYWNEIVAPENSCGAEGGNADSKDCGNCNRFLGGICASGAEEGFNPDYGDFFCKTTSCEFKGRGYRNGESWCEYDAKIGDGDDVVGSRHWRYVCNLGEVQVEPCGDYRQQICISGNVGGFETSACRVNKWRSCMDYNSEQDKNPEKNKKIRKKLCEAEVDCVMQKVWLSSEKEMELDVCVPSYPPGFKLKQTEADFEAGLNNFEMQRGGDTVCGMANMECTVIYEMKLFGGWTCVHNCECEEESFVQNMNDWCRKMGDCGGYVNIEGVITERGYSVSTTDVDGAVIPPRIDLEQYKENAEYAGGQKAEAGNFSFSSILGVPNAVSGEGGWEQGYSGSGIYAGIGAGAMGVATVAGAISIGGPFIEAVQAFWGVGASGGGIYGAGAPAANALGAFANAAAGIGASMIASSIISWAFGFGGDAAMVMMVAGVVVGVVAMVASLSAATGASALGCLSSGPFALICLAVLLIIAGLLKIFGIGETQDHKITFECKQWVPPVGGADCEKCNGDLLKPCSEYRCHSLGAACELINKGTGQEICFHDNANDASPPSISPQLSLISDDAQYSSIGSGGFSITNHQGGCVEAYSNLMFGLNTNEPAICRYDISPVEFEEMRFDFGSSAYTYNHTTAYILPDPSHGQSQGLNYTAETILYVKCGDVHGNVYPSHYAIKMCVQEGDDITGPRIKYAAPVNGGYVGHDVSSQKVMIGTNEPADCKWGNNDSSYEDMENEFICQNNIGAATINGYQCLGKLSVENLGLNEFYIRCMDQPWLNETSDRNVNMESYVYVLDRVEIPLEIGRVVPNKDFEVATSPSTVNVRVGTLHGGGVAKCSYSFTGEHGSYIDFFKTYSDTHEQEFNLIAGGYKIYVECVDETGDIAREVVKFKLKKDSSSPVISRIYILGGALHIVTNEEAECFYSEESCRFNFESDGAVSMGSGVEHTANAEAKTYYIKCKDEFGNVPSGCSVIVRCGV